MDEKKILRKSCKDLRFNQLFLFMQEVPIIDVDTLEEWLKTGKDVTVLDIRTKDQREEWQIPGSIYLNATKRLKEGDLSVMDEVSVPKNVPVVAVCAAGNTSKVAARELLKKGIEAYSLKQIPHPSPRDHP